MKVGIVLTHPTQFDVPVFQLGKNFIEVIYIEPEWLAATYDPELRHHVSWQVDVLHGYRYSIAPNRGQFGWLYQKLKAERYDLLITNGYFKKGYCWSLVLGWWFAKINALRIDTVAFNNSTKEKRIKKFLLYKLLRQFVDHFFVTGKLSKSFLVSCGVSEKKISFYGYIADSSFFAEGARQCITAVEALRASLGIGTDKLVYLCVSKHNKREAPFDTLEAFSKIDQDDKHLLLVGDGPFHSRLRRRAEELGIHSISFAGYVPFVDLPKFYAISSVFVHDSHNEPWGVSVQEALACGLVLIASDRVGAAHDLIAEGVNGFMYRFGDVQQLAEKMEAAPSLDKVGLESCNQSIQERFSYQHVLSEIKSVGEELTPVKPVRKQLRPRK